MNIQELLTKIRPIWLHRVSHNLASGAGVRENFETEIIKFYDALEQAIVTGNPGWLDPILFDWTNAPTQTELEQAQNNVSLLLNKMIVITNEIAGETLSEKEALTLLLAIIPLYTYGLEKSARHEIKARVAYISHQLDEVQNKLKRLDVSKSNFISVAAHELKTPITLIVGYTSMMRDIIAQSNQKDLDTILQGMDTGIGRLREIVDDMVDVSLIDNNILSLNFQPIWLSHILGLLKNELTEPIHKRNQALEVQSFPGDEQVIFADPGRIFQALRNICINAIKYTPDGDKIIVAGRTLPSFIEVIVKDTGIGISLEDQTLIFEKFGQIGKATLHSSSKTKFKGGGPGLGLFIARGILEAHGGAIWVESKGYDEERCPGSIFHILLPILTETPNPSLTKLFSATAASPSES